MLFWEKREPGLNIVMFSDVVSYLYNGNTMTYSNGKYVRFRYYSSMDTLPAEKKKSRRELRLDFF